jgi:hypothetical protein
MERVGEIMNYEFGRMKVGDPLKTLIMGFAAERLCVRFNLYFRLLERFEVFN